MAGDSTVVLPARQKTSKIVISRAIASFRTPRMVPHTNFYVRAEIATKHNLTGSHLTVEGGLRQPAASEKCVRATHRPRHQKFLSPNAFTCLVRMLSLYLKADNSRFERSIAYNAARCLFRELCYNEGPLYIPFHKSAAIPLYYISGRIFTHTDKLLALHDEYLDNPSDIKTSQLRLLASSQHSPQKGRSRLHPSLRTPR